MLEDIQNRPLYSIGIVSDLLEVHPETIRTWERAGVVQPPQRRNGKRIFSGNDLQRLQFIQRLVGEGLSIRAIHFYMKLYPCWNIEECTNCIYSSDQIGYTKPCWKKPGSYCKVSSDENLCGNCENGKLSQQTETIKVKLNGKVDR